MTVEALSAADLKIAGVDNILDLKLVVPGLQFGNAVGFITTHLRGVGSTAIGPGIENPIAIYVDGVYYASTSSGLFDFLNVQDVQVLKGPQGTLFGRNATGGLIQVTTREPTQKTEMDALLTYGNYNTIKTAFYISGGVTANLAADLALQVGHSGRGYGTNSATGRAVDKNDISEQGRSKWVWTPGEDTKLTTSFDFSHQRNSFTAQRIPLGYPGLPGLPPPQQGSPWDVSQDVQPLFENKNGGASIRLDQDLSFAHLMDIVAYRQAESHIDFDLDYSAAPFEGAYLHTDENQISEEIQLSSQRASVVRWVGGFYYFKSNSKYDPSHVTLPPDGASSLSVYANQGARSLAPYGQATITVLPNTDLTLGARYTNERHTAFGDLPFYAPDGSVLFHIPTPGEEKTFSKFTYRVALDHRFSEDVKVYASYNTGFKSGGFNTQSIGDPPFQPESLEASEVGVKADLFNRRVRLDLAAFHYLYSQIQVQHVNAATTGIINGASASINGVDLDLDARVTEHLSLNGSVEYLDAKFGSFPNAPIGPPADAIAPVAGGSAAGNNLPYSPRFAITLAANYDFMLPGESKLAFNVTASHTGTYQFEPDNIAGQSAYTKYNAAARWSPSDDRYEVSLWGRNLSNVASIEYLSTLASGLRNGTYAAPRTYGITVEYHMH